MALLVRGDLSHAKIAEEVGIGPSMVSRIARGEARADLQPRMRAAAKAVRRKAAQSAARWLKHLLTCHVKAGLADNRDEAGRKAREYLMDRFLDD